MSGMKRMGQREQETLHRTLTTLCSHKHPRHFSSRISEISGGIFLRTQNNKVQATTTPTRTWIIPTLQTRSAKPIRVLPISQAVYVFRRKTSPRIQNSVPRSALSLGSLSYQRPTYHQWVAQARQLQQGIVYRLWIWARGWTYQEKSWFPSLQHK